MKEIDAIQLFNLATVIYCNSLYIVSLKKKSYNKCKTSIKMIFKKTVAFDTICPFEQNISYYYI
jgi:hypothetical protein